MVYGAYAFPDSFGVHNVIAFYGNFSSILIMFLAVKSLGEEFDLKTSTFVFTTRSSRLQIITAKIVSVMLGNILIGLCGGMIHGRLWGMVVSRAAEEFCKKLQATVIRVMERMMVFFFCWKRQLQDV